MCLKFRVLIKKNGWKSLIGIINVYFNWEVPLLTSLVCLRVCFGVTNQDHKRVRREFV